MRIISMFFLVIVVFFLSTEAVYANIICNDGTESPTCQDCHQGCCSWHQGCLRDDGTNTSDLLTPIIIGGGVATGAYLYNKNKKGK